MSGVAVTERELLGALRLARTDGGQPVTLARSGPGQPLEVLGTRPFAGDERLAFLDTDGNPYRVAEAFELATRRAEVYRRNLLPLDLAHDSGTGGTQ